LFAKLANVSNGFSPSLIIESPYVIRKLSEIIQHPNFDIRHYPRENLWSINRDFEEVVVCVVSKSDSEEIEIAGMGSILEEHVKLFAAVLEDVWIQSKKIAGLETLVESITPRTLDKSVKMSKEPLDYLEPKKMIKDPGHLKTLKRLKKYLTGALRKKPIQHESRREKPDQTEPEQDRDHDCRRRDGNRQPDPDADFVDVVRIVRHAECEKGHDRQSRTTEDEP